MDLNHRPRPYQGCALPTELNIHFLVLYFFENGVNRGNRTLITRATIERVTITPYSPSLVGKGGVEPPVFLM